MSSLIDSSEKPEPARHRMVRSALFALLWITVFSVVVPFDPVMPMVGLDPSWMVGLNQAMEQGLKFGKELVFTYGPYSSISTHFYSPGTDSLMMWGSLYLAIAFCIPFYRLIKRSGWYLIVAMVFVLAGKLYHPDSLFYFYQLLVGLYCLRQVSESYQDRQGSFTGNVLLTVVFVPLGLLPLVKGSLILPSVFVMAVTSLYCLYRRQYKCMCVILITAICSPIVFWLLSGQDISTLVAYCHYALLFASGYTEAMAWYSPGHLWELMLYLICSLFLLSQAVLGKEGLVEKICIVMLVAGFLFLLFKASFVRHDTHVLIAAGFLFFIAFLFKAAYESTGIRLYGLIDVGVFTLFLTVFAALYMISSYQNVAPKSIALGFISTYSSAWHGLTSRIADSGKLYAMYVSKNREVDNVKSFPYMQGTTDIYSVGQASLIASGNVWNPRPVFQSYAAYTPELMQINQRHLLGERAPDNIVFSVESIDNRLPSLEDALSWPVIWGRYELYGFSKRNWLHLKKRTEEASIITGSAIHEMHQFGEAVRVPNSMDATFVKIIMKRSLFGALANILYKTSDLVLLTKSVTGTVSIHRFIPEMAESGFLISPLVETTVDFGQMYASGHLLSDKKVVEFMICGTEGKSVTTRNSQWNSEIEVIFTEADMSRVATKAQVFSYD